MEPNECGDVDELRKEAGERRLSCCFECPRHDRGENPVFAAGCEIHQKKSPLILFVLRDPSSPRGQGVKGCSSDERVCPWCHSDMSANNFKEKLYPLIQRALPQANPDEEERYPVYCINAVLHGSRVNKAPPAAAINACSAVLKAYVDLLKPQLTVAVGLHAVRSLSIAYPPLRARLKAAPYPITVGDKAFWWTYHPAPQSYNRKERELKKRFQEIGKYLMEVCAPT